MGKYDVKHKIKKQQSNKINVEYYHVINEFRLISRFLELLDCTHFIGGGRYILVGLYFIR